MNAIFRRIWKNRTFTFINIFGLVVGMCSALLIFVWMSHEISYDKFHVNKASLYRVNNNYPNGVSQLYCPGPAAKILKEDYPEIVNSTIYCEIEKLKISGNDKHFFTKITFVDDSFFEMFTFPFVNGVKETVFSDPNSAVLTESYALKLFGDENPIGKLVKIEDGTYLLRVSGVLKDLPQNSHIQSEVFIPAEIGYENMHKWDNNWPYIYVQLDKNANQAEVEDKISGLVPKYRTGATNTFSLEPLNRIHLYSKHGGGFIKYIIIFSAIAFLILLIACFNFINLSTAQAMKRFKEFGIRKIVGASRKKLIFQIMLETMMFSGISVVIAGYLLEVLWPSFSRFLNISLIINYDINFFLILIIISIFTGLLAGLYPSIYFSSVNPIHVVKNSFSDNSKRRITGFLKFFSIRSFLIILQYILSISFITASIIIFHQLNYMNNKELGYKKDGILIIPFQMSIAEDIDVFKNELLINPNINNVTFSFPHPVIQNSNSALVVWEGYDSNNPISAKFKMIDDDYFETFNIPIVKGSPFSNESGTDDNDYVINEVLADMMGLENPIGLSMGLNIGGKVREGKIIGVAQNFHNASLHSNIEPLAFRLMAAYSTISISINMQDVSSTISFINDKIHSFAPDFVFDYHFLEDDIEAQYNNETKSSKLILMATILAIILSALGLYGLVLFTIHQRKKEIGIRKVNGASIVNIFNLLIIRIIKWIFVSTIIAIPLTYFYIENWLDNFAYRVDIKPWMFILALIISVVISVLTVLYHSLKAAFENPVDSLRYE